MKWKRALSDQPQICSVRGCPIPPETKHWIHRWRSHRGAPWRESIYCQRCGDASRCGGGITLLGPGLILAICLLSFVVLPLAWPARWHHYLLFFLGGFTLLVIVSQRTFFWLFRNHSQVRR